MKFSSKIIKKKEIAQGIYSLFFEKPKEFKFIAGEYIEIDFPERNKNDFARNFTISSAINEPFLSITTNRGLSDYKNKLFNLNNTNLVKIDGPKGNFILNNNSHNKVMLAGGIGITVFRSMIKSLDLKKIDFKIRLIASFKNLETVIFYDELKALENEKFEIVYTLTNDEKENFEKGRINKNLIKKYISKFDQVEFYSCGSFSFNADMENLLLDMGIKLEKIKYESIID